MTKTVMETLVSSSSIPTGQIRNGSKSLFEAKSVTDDDHGIEVLQAECFEVGWNVVSQRLLLARKSAIKSHQSWAGRISRLSLAEKTVWSAETIIEGFKSCTRLWGSEETW